MVKVKLCGLKRLCDIEWTNEVMPDYAGFVFAGQKRRVTDELAASLRHHLRPEIQAVGVFQNEDIHHIADLVRKGTIQLVQLHGCEDEDYIRELRNIISVPVIQALSLDREDQLEAVRCSSADYVLLDHGTGGTGQVFDWSLLSRVHRPLFLAGGLRPENVKQALAYHPFAVDVSSGIETDGVKDYEKIKQFMAHVHSVMQQEERI